MLDYYIINLKIMQLLHDISARLLARVHLTELIILLFCKVFIDLLLFLVTIKRAGPPWLPVKYLCMV